MFINKLPSFQQNNCSVSRIGHVVHLGQVDDADAGRFFCGSNG